jgi:anti-sigma factor RsiW
MNCREAERHLPGYVDGANDSKDHARVRGHLENCGDCREQLERYRRLAVCLASLEPVEVPEDLAVRIRIQAAQVRPEITFGRRMWMRGVMVFENILEPFAVPATGGILTALVVFVLVVQNMMMGVPLGRTVPNDLPLTFIRPARLESLASFPMPGIVATEGEHDTGALVLEATLDSRGDVVSYKILSGPDNPAVHRQVDQVLLFSRFQPELSFGRPTNGGRVILGLSEVRVRG